MRAAMVIVSMLTACPALVESGMPHHMVAAPGRPTLHDGGSITGSRFTIWLCSCAGYSTALLLLAFGWQHRLWSAYVADLCCPGGQQPHGQYDRLQRLCGRHDWLRVQHCTPLRCASEPARHATEADGSMRTTAAQVGGNRAADMTGRSDFAADTTGRECSDTTDCTTFLCASEPPVM